MKNITQSFKIIAFAIVFSFGISYVYAWTAPTQQPPAGNVSSPINTSGVSQYKGDSVAHTGGLGVEGLIKGYSNIEAVAQIKASEFCIGTSCITTWPVVSSQSNTIYTDFTQSYSLLAYSGCDFPSSCTLSSPYEMVQGHMGCWADAGALEVYTVNAGAGSIWLPVSQCKGGTDGGTYGAFGASYTLHKGQQFRIKRTANGSTLFFAEVARW